MTENERRQLNQLVAGVAADAGCVGRDTVERLARQCGAGVTEDDVLAALTAQGVVVADLPDLPTQPPPALSRSVLESVAELKLQLSIEVVFGSALAYGFRLLDGVKVDDGRRLDRQSLDEVAAQLERLPDGRDRTLRQTIIAELTQAAADEGALDAIVLWEVLAQLRRYLDGSFSQRALAQQAARLWLVRQDAERLAAALVTEFESSRDPITPAPSPIPDDAPAAPPQRPAPATETLRPVTDLRVRGIPDRAGVVRLSWMPPRTGAVALRRASAPPQWEPGTTITAAELRSHGSAEPSTGTPAADGWVTREIAAPEVPVYITAMTLAGDTAVVGSTVEVSAAAPVRNLSALRFQEEVRLRWIWPDSATAALVAWWPQAGHSEPTGSRLCSRREYVAEGGFSARIGHTAMVVGVRAVYGDLDGRARGPSVEVTVPPLGVPVRYRIRRPAWTLPPPIGPRRYDVELTAAYPCELPDLVVVESRNRTQPSAPHQGKPVARVQRRALAAGEPVCVEVRLKGRGPSWLQCFVDPDRQSKDEAGIVLQPPPVHQQRVR